MEWSWLKYKTINGYTYKKIFVKKTLLRKEPAIRDLNKYAGRKILDITETNNFISSLIRKKNPFMVCRFGATEMNAIISYLQVMHFPYKDRRENAVAELCKYSGFFPDDLEMGQKFVDLMLESCQYIDLCGIWNLYMEDYILDQYAMPAQLSFLGDLEPWNLEVTEAKPWTSALKGKKVLVIHPFAETISHQYNNYRTKIFERKFEAEDILPEFELITLKAVQTINYNAESIKYRDWFEALDFMIKQCEKIDFDIAIIGCGAYGFPLAAAIKQMGKGAIHLGGATQILFGILGKRWETGGYKVMLEQIQNEYWTRPLPSEKLKNAEEIENGCYW